MSELMFEEAVVNARRMKHDDTDIALIWASDKIDELKKARNRLIEALSFYADPDSYAAILFIPDRPCGEFMDDKSDADGWTPFPYDRPMPGKRAREALDALGSRFTLEELEEIFGDD